MNNIIKQATIIFWFPNAWKSSLLRIQQYHVKKQCIYHSLSTLLYWKLLAIIWAFTNSTFLLVKCLKYCENYPTVTPRYKVSKCCLRNSADRLVLCLVATSLQSIKDTIIVKCIKQIVVKQDMYVPCSCTWRINIGKMSILPKAIDRCMQSLLRHTDG